MQPAEPNAATAAPGPVGVAHEITHAPAFAMLRVDLAPGEFLVAEAGAMVARDQSVTMAVKLNASREAGFWAFLLALVVALIRKLLGGETFIVNHFSALAGGSVWLAPAMAGDIQHRRLRGETLVLSTGAYLAHSGDVKLGMRFGGLRGILAKEGAFFLEVSGHGDLWFTSFGAIEVVDVDGGFTLDNGHLVGYEGQLTFQIGSAGGGLMGLVASGEGLICHFNGRGRIYVQSRNLQSLAGWISRILP